MLILDEDKHLFYFHFNQEKRLTFNLPTGSYYSYTPITELNVFEPYEERTYPDLQLDLNDVLPIKQKNKNKASIHLEKIEGVIPIIFDPQFYDSEYKPLQTAVLLHEVFHSVFHAKTPKERKNYFYRQHIEKQCDDAARNFMLVHGWNPSQISLAFKLLLSGKHRVNCIARNTTGKHYRR